MIGEFDVEITLNSIRNAVAESAENMMRIV